MAWRVAIIGTGTVGGWHVNVVANNPNLALTAVCDVDAAKAQRVLDKYKLKPVSIYTDAAEMYRKEKLDAVHICTPSGNHEAPAIAAMQQGKHVVVEKPMEIHADRIDRMIEAANKNGVKLAGIFQNRWNEANIALKNAVAEGRFGKLAWAGSFTPWHRTDEYYSSVNWRGTWALDGGGAVMNQGVHQVDLMQWIVGPVKTVSAFASSRIHPKIEVEDTMTCALEFASGAYGTFMSTTAMYPGAATRFEIGGEHGSALSENGLKRFQFRESRPEDKGLLERLDPALSKNTGGGANATDMGMNLHALNVAAIYEAWSKGEEAPTHGGEARKAVAIIEAMYESVRKNGQPVDVR
ncbi:MAG TPA: Gfo/Idh/MocA family oxidoreductase [Tepidisphaeraceae bacterium]|nr:Gfo/Idh/MocA family oxidoreductase [Tepidisphaeraceae bacterium]